MPNYSVFNLQPEELKILVYGAHSTGPKPLLVDDTGQLHVASVTVTAETIEAILGGTLDAVLGTTVSAGTLDAVGQILYKSFFEQSFLNVVTGDTLTPLPAITTGVLGLSSFFIYNAGTNGALAQVQISADGVNWFPDVVPTAPIIGGTVSVLVPTRFLKYTRIAYQSAVAGLPTTLDIYFNAQGT
ncbi:MAG: hypothetical protein IMX03_05985 [Brockia lithotrophica]|nr:hypothetical protein [Brockia lithotrophica]